MAVPFRVHGFGLSSYRLTSEGGMALEEMNFVAAFVGLASEEGDDSRRGL